MGRDGGVRKSLGSFHNTIKQARVLMVGAGGIGCELLKNLVLTGFGSIHVVDLDTIDLSNLNRQFLFRHEHIKKPKALVAKESALKFNPNVKVDAYHANIKDARFNVPWFQTFDVVFNALDNVDARRHVNKMCIAADVPLVDAGTTGFNGHVAVIKKGMTACYDCHPREAPKSFPVCTIRNTPSEPIHCIVWAKSYLLPELFGVSEEAPELDWREDADTSDEIKQLRHQAAELRDIRASMGTDDFARLVFEKVFTKDIEAMPKDGETWKKRKPPEALNWAALSTEAEAVVPGTEKRDQSAWTPAESLFVFKDSLRRLVVRIKALRAAADGGTEPILTFDKDDEDTLDLVVAGANLRSLVFNVQRKSKFDVKQMAGNIIPAIATTNAMVGGLTVIAAFKVLRGEYGMLKNVYLTNSPQRVFATSEPAAPNPRCQVCSPAQALLRVDLSRAKLQDLVDLLDARLGYGGECTVFGNAGELLFDVDEDVNLPEKLSDIGVEDTNFVTVADESDNPRVNLKLAILATNIEQGSDPIALDGEVDIPLKPKAPESNGPAANSKNGVSNGTDPKRKRDDASASPALPVLKKVKGLELSDVIDMDGDDDEGILVIDDD